MKTVLWRRANREDAAGNAPLSLRITIAKERAELAANLEVPAAYWNAALHCVELPSRRDARRAELAAAQVLELNDQLTELKNAANAAYKSLKQDYIDGRRPAPPTAREVLEKVRGINVVPAAPITIIQAAARFMETITAPGINKSENTLRSYRSRIGNLLEFFDAGERKAKKFLLRDVNLPLGRQLERWCLAQRDADGFPRFEHSSMAKQVNMLQMLVAWGAMEGHIPANTLHGYKYQSIAPATSPRALTALEVELFAGSVFHGAMLNDVADMFIFCCYQGLSFVDYCRFAVDPVPLLHTDSAGREWLRMTRQKMRHRKPEGFSVPFFPEARAIFERRRGQLPIRANKTANETLKLIARDLGLSLAELTFKDSRSTFSQLWKDRGVSGAVVAAMMGDEEQVVNKNYSRIREEAIRNEFDRLNLTPTPTR